jgi:hypothetical protein
VGWRQVCDRFEELKKAAAAALRSGSMTELLVSLQVCVCRAAHPFPWKETSRSRSVLVSLVTSRSRSVLVSLQVCACIPAVRRIPSLGMCNSVLLHVQQHPACSSLSAV